MRRSETHTQDPDSRFFPGKDGRKYEALQAQGVAIPLTESLADVRARAVKHWEVRVVEGHACHARVPLCKGRRNGSACPPLTNTNTRNKPNRRRPSSPPSARASAWWSSGTRTTSGASSCTSTASASSKSRSSRSRGPSRSNTRYEKKDGSRRVGPSVLPFFRTAPRCTALHWHEQQLPLHVSWLLPLWLDGVRLIG